MFSGPRPRRLIQQSIVGVYARGVPENAAISLPENQCKAVGTVAVRARQAWWLHQTRYLRRDYGPHDDVIHRVIVGMAASAFGAIGHDGRPPRTLHRICKSGVHTLRSQDGVPRQS